MSDSETSKIINKAMNIDEQNIFKEKILKSMYEVSVQEEITQYAKNVATSMKHFEEYVQRVALDIIKSEMIKLGLIPDPNAKVGALSFFSKTFEALKEFDLQT
jgi:hypothetical protein